MAELVAKHLNVVGRTRTLEATAQQLVDADFPDDALVRFVMEVCAWGGYKGIAGRVLRRNSVEDIRIQFRSATKVLDANAPDVGAALAAVNQLCCLGRPSFASKHLRFLRPEHCPVLDSVLATTLGYSLNREGYRAFASDCATIAVWLQTASSVNPASRKEDRWYAADVEMALFALARQF
jgi:hypothetical protein